jgi:hypothetical protein
MNEPNYPNGMNHWNQKNRSNRPVEANLTVRYEKLADDFGKVVHCGSEAHARLALP